MLGMDQAQRSNAVGNHTSYLPDADPGRMGGNTYTGVTTEPTIQDYENFFGPSARDIKTDMQRFKRHGRWHLPDVLKGPNPWLTDRIDGLITDATNSPFTTKILPYRFKDDVDGKMKWNVWSFDEGMASRVPYEAAARTLTQSKRSFAGYMVRQGMAIVMEHNFMMSPKGRENFKNQLNQLIGSIQYTNDLDVHMALVLAPSYQKTMRERYFTLDKSPSQICREFVDLFGMMQKNVNALDILIEEGKAILRTWGGPMPDFLLCNSKLTFQMTMTPEKTNYITQGSDGVKRLRQGPDLTSYRGLSVIHSRSFAMEMGQHPRDILRRRVRTAEYYRILPNKKNPVREFEFYNEERDTWFTLSFTDLLRYARYAHLDGMDDDDTPSAVDRVYNSLTNQPMGKDDPVKSLGAGMQAMLGAVIQQTGALDTDELRLLQTIDGITDNMMDTPNFGGFSDVSAGINNSQTLAWIFYPFQYDMGIKHLPPKNNRVWSAWDRLAKSKFPSTTPGIPRPYLVNSLNVAPKLSMSMMRNLFHNLKRVSLNDPFVPGSIAAVGTPEWYLAFSFYVDMYKRSGFPIRYHGDQDMSGLPSGINRSLNAPGLSGILTALPVDLPVPQRDHVDITYQMLRPRGGVGSVNHPLIFPIVIRGNLDAWVENDPCGGNARTFLLTYEMLAPLLREYDVNGVSTTGIDYIVGACSGWGAGLLRAMQDVLGPNNADTMSIVDHTLVMLQPILTVINDVLRGLTRTDPGVPDAVYLARSGVSTWPLGVTSASHILHPYHAEGKGDDYKNCLITAKNTLGVSYGHLNATFLEAIRPLIGGAEPEPHIWVVNRPYADVPGLNVAVDREICLSFWMQIRGRILEDPVVYSPLSEVFHDDGYLVHMPRANQELGVLTRNRALHDYLRRDGLLISKISPQDLGFVTIDMNQALQEDKGIEPIQKTSVKQELDRLQDVELVIVRPNIEHNMLGIIMGLGGESLGSTLWGQTELSVYDDSMHGIWGMSYKYHERAIVFNERNLIRLWDIAYDGYNGGKDDTYVDWMNPNASNGYKNFQELTMDVSKNYRGPSMMVMAFVHDKAKLGNDGAPLFDKHFRRNWPSPIVFHDTYQKHGAQTKETLPLDYDNLQVIDVDEFRVFNNELYVDPYNQYKAMMPSFHEMHMMRKSAGQSSAEAETHTDSLAFQGSMRIKEGGVVVQDIQGSGHHGPDYIGVASVRSGKGQKVSGQAPTLHRLI